VVVSLEGISFLHLGTNIPPNIPTVAAWSAVLISRVMNQNIPCNTLLAAKAQRAKIES